MRLPHNAPAKKSFQISRYIVVIIVAVVAVLFAIILWFVYPKTHLHNNDGTINHQPDEISNLYLRHEVNARPNDLKLRLRLIHQELALGKLKQASELIQPYLHKHPQSQLSWQFKWYDYRILFLKATAEPEKNIMQQTLGYNAVKQPKKIKHAKVLLSTVKKSMQQLQHAPLTLDQQITLSSDAIALKFYDVANQLGAKLYADQKDLNAPQLASLAKNSYLSGNYLLCTEFYMAAFKKVKDSTLQKKYYIAAINSLLAGNLLPQQFPLIVNESQQYKNDPQVLIVLAKAALASKKSTLAATWMRQAIGLQYLTSGGGG
ncbi:MAG: hypothetical protein P1U63_11580 [Coxiellaceae bacterium]|nr:hypothetical protein [Coxiellaceae bacterium]